MYDIAHWHDWLPGFAPESLKRPPTDQSSNIWLHSIYVYLSHGSTDSFEPPQLQGTHPLTLIWGICPGILLRNVILGHGRTHQMEHIVILLLAVETCGASRMPEMSGEPARKDPLTLEQLVSRSRRVVQY